MLLAQPAEWPESYFCKVVTDAVEVQEFNLHLTGQEMSIDRDILALKRNMKVTLEKSGPEAMSGEGYLRVMSSNNFPAGKVFITQNGNLQNPSTILFVDFGTKEQILGQRRLQFTGYCAVGESKGSKGPTK